MESFNLSHLIRTTASSSQVVVRTLIIPFQSLASSRVSFTIKSFKLGVVLEEGVKQYFLGSDINLEFLVLILRNYLLSASMLMSKTIKYRHIVHSFISRVWAMSERPVKSCLN